MLRWYEPTKESVALGSVSRPVLAASLDDLMSAKKWYLRVFCWDVRFCVV